MKRRVYFRDRLGRFLPSSDRYTDRVKMVQRTVRGSIVTVADDIDKTDGMTPERLSNLVTKTEFEGMPEALRDVKEYSSSKKYKAWDIANQIDKTKGLRRKLLKITMDLREGEGKKARKRTVSFYQEITANQQRSYQLFKRINQEIGFEGGFLYDRVGRKLLSDRRGKRLHLKGIKVQEVL